MILFVDKAYQWRISLSSPTPAAIALPAELSGVQHWALDPLG